MPARTVLVSSLGLMGGSLAAALAQAGWRVLLHHRRPEVAAEAAARGWGSAIADLAQARGAEIAVVCAPLSAIPGCARAIAAATPAVITDVGSTKGALCRELADLGGRFVGSHPMAGSHLQGLAHADAALYRGRVAIVTPSPATPPAALALVEELWHAAGSRIVRLDAELHDRAVAAASHLPHLLACAAAAQLDEVAAPLCAGGFRDTTRVAASSTTMWAEILATNAGAVQGGITATIGRLQRLQTALARGDAQAVTAWLEEAKSGRERYERAQVEGGSRKPEAGS